MNDTKNEFKNLMVMQIQCPKCKDWIYSRAPHDFRRCSCGNIGVDGGHWDDDEEYFTYFRFMGDYALTKHRVCRVTADQRMLYDDWNTSEDKFGRIKGD